MTATTAPSQTVLKRLAGGLSFVCLVLLLMAIEQPQTVAAWQAVRHGAAPAVQRAAEALERLPAAASGGLERLGKKLDRPPAAVGSGDRAPGGAYAPADPAVAAAAGELTIAAAELQFETGDRLRTRPLRIAFGRDAFAPGQTFATRLDAPVDAQIELREVVTPGPTQLCGGEAAGAVALLRRGDQIDLMVFRAGVAIGPATPPSALCGAWRFAAR